MVSTKERKGWRYIAVKTISPLFHKKTSNHNGVFCCLTSLNSFRTEIKLKIHKKMCKTKDFCGVEMPSEKNKILDLINI